MYDYLLKKLLASIAKTGISPKESAQKYLSQIKGPIRLFGTDGPGYGDQMFIINIAHYLYHLGYRGILEVIGNNNSARRYQEHSDFGPADLDQQLGLLPLAKFLFLTGQNLSETAVFIPGMGNIRALALDKFLKNKGTQIELAIMGGFIPYIQGGYNVLGVFGEDILKFANTEQAICFEPFTAVAYPFTLSTNPGFILFNKHRIEIPYYLAKTLPYLLPPVDEPTRALQISAAMRQLATTHFNKTTLLHAITQKNMDVHTFAIYGLNFMRYSSPHYGLFNLIIAASKLNIPTEKPLLVFVMDNISDEVWAQLQHYFQLSVIYNRKPPELLVRTLKDLPHAFIDPGINQTLPTDLWANTTYIIRLGSLPFNLFNKLFTQSTYPPVYEGANSGMLLQSIPRYGLYCPGLYRIDLSIPSHLIGREICSRTEPYFLWKNGNPTNTIESLMQDCLSTPRELPQVDRISYALSEAHYLPSCKEQAQAECAFFQPMTPDIFPYLLLASETFIKGIGYGVLTGTFTCFLKSVFKLNTLTATTTAETLTLLAQYLIDGYYIPSILSIFFIFLLLVIKGFATLIPFADKIDMVITASIAFFNFLPVLRGLNFEKFLLTLLAMSCLVGGKKLGTAITTTIGNRCHSLFFKNHTHAAETLPVDTEQQEPVQSLHTKTL